MKFDAADVFIFNPLCRFREESFGGIIILNQGTEWLQKDAFEKMRMLSQEGSFTLQKLQELFTVETEAAIQIVNRLLHNTIISHTKEVKACG